MDPNQSIDGLNLTLHDLNEQGWRKAIVAIMHRTEAAAASAKIDDETRTAIAAHLKSAHLKDERVKQVLSDLIKPTQEKAP